MKSVRFLCLLFVAMTAASCASVVVTKVNSSTASKGMIYALPRTVARIQIKLDRTERVGAPYVLYSRLFAPEGDVVCKDTACTQELPLSYSLQEGATFSTYGEPDPDEVYLVEFTGGGSVDQSMSMTWSEAGLLSSAGASVTNRTTDVAMSGLKLVTGLGAKGLFGASGMADANGFVIACSKDKAKRSANDAAVLRIFEKSGGIAKADLIDRWCSFEVAVRDSWQIDEPLLEAATAAYVDKIAPLTKARKDVIEGLQQTVAPAQQVEVLDAEIAAKLTKLFLGSKSTKTWEGLLDVRGIDGSRQQPLGILRIDAANGFCILSDAEIAPESKAIPKGFANLGTGSTLCNAAPLLVNLNWNYHPRQSAQLSSMIKDDPEGDRSFRYRVPSQIKVELADGNKSRNFGTGLMWVAQLGEVVSLPAKRRSKTLGYDLAFIESTGALKSFKLSSTGGLDSGTIDSLAAAGGTYLDAETARATKRKAAQDASALAQDELTILTRESALLTLKDEICTLRKKYGQACADDAP
ncbi:MAG TPA: hypothetical protein VFU13_06830 [Steroidobacteraceae bacterium]|nr:hypothetical protein [Steroidobacteraceae bacterium]